MSKPTTYGIIGCGMMGQEHLRNIVLLDNTTVGAIFEPDAEMRARARQFAPDAQFVDSIAELLAIETLDCLMIASPNFRHIEQLEEIANTLGAARALPVLVEKPLFTDPDHVARLAAFEATYPAPVWVAMEYRYMPPVATLLRDAQAATGGITMFTIREHRFPFLEKVGDWNRFNRYSGGTFVEKCCHFFDLMRLVTGSDPIRVMASGGIATNHLDERYNGEAPDILDHGYVIVEFANGMRAMLELCMFAEGARYQEEISATGPQGKIEALVPGPGRFWPAHLGAPPVAQVIVSPRDPKGPQVRDIPVDPRLLEAGDHNGSTFYQHQGFLELVRGQRAAPEVSLADGRWAVLTGMAAQRAITEHRVVELAELM
ncbi:Putative oxidoreductase YteT precursor [Aquimixticola soesokkakensis]|uniref:Putative oxidoreductase YteT n=1 Tax=Aquimixticola soesokkakensis TaxID=1519096 RepID=A0A1Y5RSS9_9RHOB|nr:Gfo/Idh/MocA family oxidoreductase [Aquimixticola soesokkakensis]SLN24301.1 Putative oxidoreductase YteT precursor [Aquimixticola soesokkakensis]